MIPPISDNATDEAARVAETLSVLTGLSRRLAGYFLGIGGKSRSRIPPLPENYLSPDELKKSLSEHELRAKAEQYFSGVKDWGDLIRKPFARIDDAPNLLINLGVLIRGMRLAPGMTVLDFAAGSCWATAILRQLGCRVIAIDLAYSGLLIGQELIRRRPVGDEGESVLVSFDGEQIPLADRSVDRIFCFDAFHHVLRQRDVLSEMHRVLVDGGIAVFGEPGPYHSRSGQSQFEMKTYGVIEDDVDLEQIWSMASEVGFTDMRVALFNGNPLAVSLEDFRIFSSGGLPAVDFVHQTQDFLAHVHDFFLFKGDATIGDSRRAGGLTAAIEVNITDVRTEATYFSFVVRNDGTSRWLPSEQPVGGVSLGCHLFTPAGELVQFDFHWESLSSAREGIQPGETVKGKGALPPLDPGEYLLEFDLVSHRVTWFGQKGSPTLKLPLTVKG